MKRGCYLLVLGALLLSLSAMAEEKLPLEYFVKHSDYMDVKISPDGEYFAVRVIQDDQTVLAFIRRKDMKVTGGAKPASGGHVISVRWVNDERVIYSVANDSGFRDEPLSDGQLYAVNRDGGRHELIFGDRAASNETGSLVRGRAPTRGTHRLISLLPDDKANILIAIYPYKVLGAVAYTNQDAMPEVVRLDVYRGKQRKVERLPIPGATGLADDKGNIRFAIGYDSEGYDTLSYRSEEGGDWIDFKIPEGIDASAMPITFDSDSNSVLLFADKGDNRTEALIKLNLVTGEQKTLYHDANYDLVNWGFDPLTQEPLYVRTYEGTATYHYIGDLEHPLTRSHRMLSNAFSGQAVTITSATRDKKEMIIFVQSDRNPGEYYLFNSETKKASFVMSTRSWVDKNLMRPMQEVSFTARDNETIHAFLTKPNDQGGPFPMVIFVHGGPHQIGDYWRYDSEVQLLAHHGYAVLQVNYRGSDGYGSRFEEIGYGEWGGKMQDDLTDATKWAVEQGLAASDRMCIYGGSYGGYAALMGAVKEADLYRCAIGFAGVYDLRMMYEKGDILLNRGGPAYLRMVLGEDKVKLGQRSPLHNVSHIKAPILLAHGGEDRRVPIDHALELRDALKSAGKSVEWIKFSSEGHGLFAFEHRMEFYSHLLEFLNKHTQPIENH